MIYQRSKVSQFLGYRISAVGLIFIHLTTIILLYGTIVPTTIVEAGRSGSGSHLKDCGEKPGYFQIAERQEVSLNVLKRMEKLPGGGSKARCRMPFNAVCLPSTANCEYDNQCCGEDCKNGSCGSKKKSR